jgi:YD repeat-containing protein
LVACLVATLGLLRNTQAGYAQQGGAVGGQVAGGVLTGSLVGLGSPVEDEQLLTARQATLQNPVRVAERKRSRTEFEHLGATRAIQVARESFPDTVEDPAGGPLRLPAGDRIVKYEARNAAAITLPDGKHGVVESLGPIATPSGDNRFTPINLALHSTESGYAPANSDVAVEIPKHAFSGVSMHADGVSLTPVNGQGQPLTGSEGVQEGASVLYANTQTDTDTLAKPTSGGFEIDSLLRSVDSPETLYFKVGMPSGAKLVRGQGGARVLLGGRTIAVIASPSAQDAQGTEVPVRMSVVGRTLVVTVKRGSGEYDYPIDVDPHAYDSTIGLPSTEGTNWEFYYEKGGFEEAAVEGAVMHTVGSINAEEFDEFRYPAHGEASVTYIEDESKIIDNYARTKLEFVHGSTVEEPYTLAGPLEVINNTKKSYGDKIIEGVEGFGALYHGNELKITQTATQSAPAENSNWFHLYNATVGVLQEKHPEVSFNTSEATISEASGLQNVLYGSGGWLSEGNGAVEIFAKDPGLGVSYLTIKDLTAGAHGEHWKVIDPVYADHLCSGVWCAQTFEANSAKGMYFTYNKEMAEGTNTFELCAEDQAFMGACTDATVKVDGTAPGKVKLTGMASEGAELSATQHQLTVEATDPAPGSGVKSIAVLVDGKEIGSPTGSCTPVGSAECTAARMFTIDGEVLGAGEHRLTVLATDNADNVSTTKYTFAIRNATPVHIGPGTVDPVTGQLALTVSDVDMAGAGKVSRTYRSRSLSAGVEGPLGSQWSLGVGGNQPLKLLPDGNAELASANGSLTTFASNGIGGFEAPKGDGNLTLEAKEKEAGRGITEYLLKDPTAGTTTVFARPLEEKQFVVPSYFGEVSSPGVGGSGGYSGDEVAIGTKNNLWVVDDGNARIDEFNDNREFIMAFGFGVRNGEQELQTCTTNCKAGIREHHPGDLEPDLGFGYDNGIAVDSSGDIWITNANERIYEYNEKGEFEGSFGSSPRLNEPQGITVGPSGRIWVVDSGANQVDEFNAKHELESSFAGGLDQPRGIAVHNGYIWVADEGNERVAKFTEKGELLSQIGGKYGEANGEFKVPLHVAVDAKGDVWVTDYSDRVQEFSESGAYSGQLDVTNARYKSGAGISGVAVDGAGDVWLANDLGPSSVEEWTHSTWLPTKTESTAPGDNRATSYRSVMVEGKVVTEPIEELGPVPTGVSCGKNPAEVSQAEVNARLAELKAGCRALSFTYAEKTKSEIGEGPTEWGEYNGRLMKVSFTAYNPAKGAEEMETKVVAEYAYDKQGRLRAEWDPRIETSTACGKTCSALKATYGYDAEGHMTALSPPGEESWAFIYGDIAGDSSMGRLLKVTRAPASAGVWDGLTPKNTGEAPKISGLPVVGVRMAVTHGVWSNSPVVYSYQWERCRTLCEAIVGAINGNFTPVAEDEGWTLQVRVTAINGGGDATATTGMSGQVHTSSTERTEGEYQRPEPGTTVEYRVPLFGSSVPYQMTSVELAKWAQKEDLPEEATAVFPPDEPQGWPASDYKRATIDYMDGEARTVNMASPSGGISTIEYNKLNEVTRELSAANRAAALEKGSKSAEVAESLSVKKVYNTEGTQLLETYGPEHKIRLANGTEEATRNREAFAYDEGEPSGEKYNLVTKATQWSETAAKAKLAERETVTSYNGQEKTGQEKLGWKLRQPTLVTSKSEGHVITSPITYEEETGEVRETSTSVTLGAPAFMSQLSGEGKESPLGEAVDSSGDLWVADAHNDKIDEYSPQGIALTGFGSAGTEAGKFQTPWGVAINKATGNIYVSDVQNNRVQEFSSTGAFIRTFGFAVGKENGGFEICTAGCRKGSAGSGSGEFREPAGMAIDPAGHVWVSDAGNNRVEEFSEKGEYLSQFGSPTYGDEQLKDPTGIAISDGALYVADTGYDRVEEFSTAGTYLAEFGSEGFSSGEFKSPEAIATDPISGDLYVADTGNARVQQFTANGIFLTAFGSSGKGSEQFSDPTGVAVNAAGAVYVSDTGNERVTEWEPRPQTPAYTSAFGAKGSGAGQLETPSYDAIDAHGDVWVPEYGSNRISEFSASGVFIKAVGWDVNNKEPKEELQVCTTSCKAGSSGTGNGEFSDPTGIAIGGGDLYVVDSGNNRVEVLNEEGKYVTKWGATGTEGKEFKTPLAVAVGPNGNVWVGDSLNRRVQEFSATGAFIEALGWDVNEKGKEEVEVCTTEKTCKAGSKGTGAGQFASVWGLAFAGSNLYVTDSGNNRVEEFNEKSQFVKAFGYGVNEGNETLEVCTTVTKCREGIAGSHGGQLANPVGIAVSPISGFLFVTDTGNNRVEVFTPAGGYLTQFGVAGTGNGQLKFPEGAAINSSGEVYVVDDLNHRIEKWTPAPRPGNEAAKNAKTTYYSAGPNAEYENCGKRPAWANLPCQTEPVVQPGDSGPPPLPVTTFTYNIWDDPETVTETIGSVTRMTKKKYDSAGREIESEESSTSSEDTALPAVADEYNSETGALVKLKATIEGHERTISSIYNTLGELTSYTDAEGSTTKYMYDVDARVEEVKDPKGSQSYTYNTTTGFLEKLQDNGPEGKKGAGLFTASYDVEGAILTEGYPDGLTAKYTYNPVGQATNLEYEKTTDCKEKCVWFDDTEAFGAGGETAAQTSSLSSESYSYNEMGLPTQTQETPVEGKGCTTRLYGYDGEGERTSATTIEPNAKGECATEGGIGEEHFYDAMGRLIDPGVTYDKLGNITKMPELDAGGSGIISSFYVDGQTATQEQSEKTIKYSYDPAGRTMVAVLKHEASTITTISHYAGPGNALTWTCEEAGECKEEKETKWSRDIPGIDGALDAIQTDGATPVLQIHDLQGDIIATAADNETETKLLSTHNVTEFGVPQGTAPEYSWLGADGAKSELGTGVITTAGATYVPQPAETLQTDTIAPPGAAPNGAMETEVYRPPELPWADQSGREGAANSVAEQRALEAEAAPIFSDPGPWELLLTKMEVHELIEYIYELHTARNVVRELTEVLAPEGTHEYLDIHGTVSDVLEHWGEENVATWANQLTKDLEGCLNIMESQNVIQTTIQRCQVVMLTYTVEVPYEDAFLASTVPDYAYKAAVSYCDYEWSEPCVLLDNPN